MEENQLVNKNLNESFLKDYDEEDMIDLFEVFKILFRRRLFIIGVSVLFSVIGIIVALILPPKYTATTKIIYQSSQSGSSSFSALAALAGVNLNESSNPSNYLEDIIKSNDFLDSLINSKWHTKDGRLVNFIELWKIEVDSSAPEWKAKLMYGLKSALKDKYILFSRDNKSGVISITTEFEDPVVAYEVNKKIVELLNDFILTKMHFKATENRKFIEERLEQAKKDLRKAENNLLAFREKNIIVSSPKLRLEETRLLRELEIQNTIFVQLQKQYELAKIEEKKDIPVLDIIDRPVIPVVKSKPKRKVIVIVFTMFGFMLSLLSVFLWEWYQSNKDKIKEIKEEI